MHSKLVKGRILTPSSVTAARARATLLDHEVARIAEQLADEERPKRYRTAAEYDTWRSRAIGAQKCFVEERRQLTEWMDAQGRIQKEGAAPVKDALYQERLLAYFGGAENVLPHFLSRSR